MRKELFKKIRDFVVFDIETTGLDCRTEKITEISALKITDLKIVDSFTTLVNPGIYMSNFISELTGITNEMVKDAPSPKMAVKAFLDFSEGFVLAGHNIKRFDLGFIEKVAEEELGITVDNDFLDSLTIAKVLLPDLQKKSLESLSAYYNVSYQGAHRAEADCRINFEIIKKLFAEFDNPNIQIRTCPSCGDFLIKRKGKYGSFWGCCGYPICKYTEKL